MTCLGPLSFFFLLLTISLDVYFIPLSYVMIPLFVVDTFAFLALLQLGFQSELGSVLCGCRVSRSFEEGCCLLMPLDSFYGPSCSSCSSCPNWMISSLPSSSSCCSRGCCSNVPPRLRLTCGLFFSIPSVILFIVFQILLCRAGDLSGGGLAQTSSSVLIPLIMCCCLLTLLSIFYARAQYRYRQCVKSAIILANQSIS